MSAGNTVTLVGNATRDPELRFTSNGQAVTSFGLAVNRRWKNKDDEWEEAVSFFDVTVWREQAENVAESIEKGSRVFVTGRLDQRSWETDEGDKRSKVEIVADEVGPSLRWATAEVTKNERSDESEGSRSGGRSGGSKGRGRSGGGSKGGRSGSSGSSRGRSGGRSKPEPEYDPDEEPF